MLLADCKKHDDEVNLACNACVFFRLARSLFNRVTATSNPYLPTPPHKKLSSRRQLHAMYDQLNFTKDNQTYDVTFRGAKSLHVSVSKRFLSSQSRFPFSLLPVSDHDKEEELNPPNHERCTKATPKSIIRVTAFLLFSSNLF